LTTPSEAAILEWLAGDGVGASSKMIALAALSRTPKRADTNYPHDPSDFGRCYRLLAQCPGARAGLDKLGAEAGPVWAALVARWAEIERAFLMGEGCYELMQSIIRPAEKKLAVPPVRLGDGVTITFHKGGS
jgi:hypothetical protein